jgi:hypothetical protein
MGLSDTAERRASWLSVFPQLVGSRLITGARCHMTWLPDYVGGLRHLGLSCSMVISPILARSFSDSVRLISQPLLAVAIR